MQRNKKYLLVHSAQRQKKPLHHVQGLHWFTLLAPPTLPPFFSLFIVTSVFFLSFCPIQFKFSPSCLSYPLHPPVFLGLYIRLIYYLPFCVNVLGHKRKFNIIRCWLANLWEYWMLIIDTRSFSRSTLTKRLCSL